jgi:hypothetical protein
MKHLSIIVILACLLLASVTGCSSATSSNGNNGNNIATYGKTDISCGIWIGRNSGAVLDVELTPTNNAQAGVTYVVDLYYKGVYHASSSVEWNQPQLDVKEPQDVNFPISDKEYSAYSSCLPENGCYLTDTFSVKVHH